MRIFLFQHKDCYPPHGEHRPVHRAGEGDLMKDMLILLHALLEVLNPRTPYPQFSPSLYYLQPKSRSQHWTGLPGVGSEVGVGEKHYASKLL